MSRPDCPGFKWPWLLGLPLVLVFSAPRVKAQVSPLAGLYDIRPHKNLAIDYTTKGKFEGSIRVYIHGDTAVTILDQSVAGRGDSGRSRIHWVEIQLPEGIYSFDLSSGSGKSIDNRRWFFKQKLAGLKGGDRRYFESNKEKIRAHLVSRAIGPQLRPTSVDFLGRKALRYRLPGGAVMTFWNGILMQMDLPASNVHLSATKIDLNFAAPDSIFALVHKIPVPRDSLVSAALRNQVDGLIQALRTRTLDSFLVREGARN